MSKYTTELRYLCEKAAGLEESKGYNSVNEIVTAAAPHIFDFDFPIFDEDYRLVLERKILLHFYTREIGEETAGLWKLRLQERLQVIMPYYNQLYSSSRFDFDPLHDIDLTRTRKGNDKQSDESTSTERTTDNREVQRTGTGTANESGSLNSSRNDNSTQWELYSDTPQGAITGLENGDYLTNATKNTNNSATTETGSSSNTRTSTDSENTKDDVTRNSTRNENRTVTNIDEYIETVKGKAGGTTYSKMIIEYRATLINIDMMVLNELNDLFMLIY